MQTEKIIQEVVASARSVSQKGDVSRFLLEQGFFDDNIIPEGLKRDKFLSNENPIDVLKVFERQQIN
jgi:hypothetical protein